MIRDGKSSRGDAVDYSIYILRLLFFRLSGLNTDCCGCVEEKEWQTIYYVSSVGSRDVILRLHQFGVARAYHLGGPHRLRLISSKRERCDVHGTGCVDSAWTYVDVLQHASVDLLLACDLP